jgi:hypothetical protein
MTFPTRDLQPMKVVAPRIADVGLRGAGRDAMFVPFFRCGKCRELNT